MPNNIITEFILKFKRILIKYGRSVSVTRHSTWGEGVRKIGLQKESHKREDLILIIRAPSSKY